MAARHIAFDDCRLCGDSSRFAPIYPCDCKKGVHATCLDLWRINSTDPDDFWRCQTCGKEYTFKIYKGKTLFRPRKMYYVFFWSLIALFFWIVLSSWVGFVRPLHQMEDERIAYVWGAKLLALGAVGFLIKETIRWPLCVALLFSPGDSRAFLLLMTTVVTFFVAFKLLGIAQVFSDRWFLWSSKRRREMISCFQTD